MKKFTTPCFVRIDRIEDREPLAKWLREIGYKRDPSSRDRNSPYFITEPRHVYGPMFVHTNGYIAGFQKLRPQSIDCGKNVELFKAIAALNDTDDYMQWFVMITDNGEKWKLERDKETHYGYLGFAHKATPSELIEHFR